MKRFSDYKDGDKYGKLTIKGDPFKKTEGVTKSNFNRYHVTVECECGTVKDFPVAYFYDGRAISCGCYRSTMRLKGSFAKNGKKKCSRCQLVKDVSHFSISKRCKDGYCSCCKECDYRKVVKARYSLTDEQYVALLENQGGVCKLCGKKPKGKRRLAVDHSHYTGEVRGLLCILCNTLLGKLGDDQDDIFATFQRIMLYLQGSDKFPTRGYSLEVRDK